MASTVWLSAKCCSSSHTSVSSPSYQRWFLKSGWEFQIQLCFSFWDLISLWACGCFFYFFYEPMSVLLRLLTGLCVNGYSLGAVMIQKQPNYPEPTPIWATTSSVCNPEALYAACRWLHSPDTHTFLHWAGQLHPAAVYSLICCHQGTSRIFQASSLFHVWAVAHLMFITWVGLPNLPFPH